MEMGEGVSMDVYPNPARNEATVSFSTRLAYTLMNIELTDLAGRKMWAYQQGSISPGNHLVDIPVNQWSAGTYLISVSLDGRRLTKQLVIQ
jgi:hypothetical protein